MLYPNLIKTTINESVKFFKEGSVYRGVSIYHHSNTHVSAAIVNIDLFADE